MTGPLVRRGQPVVVLGAILLVWVMARVAASIAPVAAVSSVEADWHQSDKFAPVVRPRSAIAPRSAGGASSVKLPVPVRVEVGSQPVRPLPAAKVPAAAPAFAPVPAAVAGGHGLLWLAAVAQLPMPAAIAAIAPAPAAAASLPAASLAFRAPAAMPRADRASSRWSADGWFLLRGGKAPRGATAFASYGASQIGAVARYRIDELSVQRPAITLRAAAALDGTGEREVALGLAAHPVPSLPVGLIAEVRATRPGGGAVALRPAITAVTGLAPQALPLGLRAQGYGQAGYVGGAGATGFVDGEVRVDGAVIRQGPAELRLGAAAWGGAQEGAARLDIGPAISLGLSAGDKAARLGLDWRVRVAGNAAPASGPALTLSAGF